MAVLQLFWRRYPSIPTDSFTVHLSFSPSWPCEPRQADSFSPLLQRIRLLAELGSRSYFQDAAWRHKRDCAPTSQSVSCTVWLSRIPPIPHSVLMGFERIFSSYTVTEGNDPSIAVASEDWKVALVQAVSLKLTDEPMKLTSLIRIYIKKLSKLFFVSFVLFLKISTPCFFSCRHLHIYTIFCNLFNVCIFNTTIGLDNLYMKLLSGLILRLSYKTFKMHYKYTKGFFNPIRILQRQCSWWKPVGSVKLLLTWRFCRLLFNFCSWGVAF